MTHWYRSVVPFAVFVGLLITVTWSEPAFAQEEVDLSQKLRVELGAEVAKEISQSEVNQIAALCPQEDEDELIKCMRANDAVKKILATVKERATSDNPEPIVEPLNTNDPKNTIKYPKAAKRILGVERLRRLPKIITSYLEDEDWVAIHRLCKTMDPDAILHCISKQAEPIMEMVGRRIIMSMLALMDVEIPLQMTVEQIDALGDACEKAGEPWAKCVVEHGVNADKCDDAEEVVARCLVDNEVVSEMYLSVSERKRALFGDALYVEFAGLLALLSFDAVKQARAACPQNDAIAARKCLANQPVAGQFIRLFETMSKAVVEDTAKKLAKNNQKLDVAAYTEQTVAVFMQMPLHAIRSLASDCVKQHPEYDEPKTVEDVDKAIACVRGSAFESPVANPAFSTPAQLGGWLGNARKTVTALLIKQEKKKQGQAMKRIWIALLIVTGLGFLVVLLMPLWLAKRYPDAQGLWGASAAAAGTLVVTLLLLGGALTAMRAAQSAVATDYTSPKIRVADAAFDALARQDSLEGFSELSKAGLDFLKTPLKQITARKQQAGKAKAKVGALIPHLSNHWVSQLETPQMKRIIFAIHGNSPRAVKNIKKIKGHIGTFKSTIGVYKKVDWIMGIVPVVLALLALLLYMLPLRHTLMDIATAPARAAQSGQTGGQIASAKDTIVAEVKSALPFIGCIVVLLPVVGFFLAYAVDPLVELLLISALLSVFYIASSDVSPFVLFVGNVSVMVLLVLALATYIVGLTLALGAIRKIFRARFHFGHSLASFGRFWKWGAGSLLLVMVIPLVFSYGVSEAYEAHLVMDFPIKGKYLLTVPLIGMLLYPLVFWAARGLVALEFIMKYPVPTTAEEDGATTPFHRPPA